MFDHPSTTVLPFGRSLIGFRKRSLTFYPPFTGAVEILREWQVEKAPGDKDTADTRDELVGAFVRMDLQATIFDEGRVPALRVGDGSPPGSPPQSESDMAPFESLCEAQDRLFTLLHSGFVFLVQNTDHKFADPQFVPKSVFEHRRQILTDFDDWNWRLSSSQQPLIGRSTDVSLNGLPQGSIQRKALSVMKLHWQSIRLLLLHSLQDAIRETAPSFDDIASEQLQLAREVLYTSVESDSSESSRDSPTRHAERSFSIHLGIVTPIFLLALKTRRLGIREAAVDLLQAARGRREAFHDAEAMAKLVCQLEMADAHAGVRETDALMDEPPDTHDAVPRALEWEVEHTMNVSCWGNEAERHQGLERLWATVA